MSDEHKTEFDESAWLERVKNARTKEDFKLLLSALPSTPPLADDDVIDLFQWEMGEITRRKAAEELQTDLSAALLRGWCRFWFMAEWCLPADQQKRCTERVLRLAGYA